MLLILVFLSLCADGIGHRSSRGQNLVVNAFHATASDVFVSIDLIIFIIKRSELLRLNFGRGAIFREASFHTTMLVLQSLCCRRLGTRGPSRVVRSRKPRRAPSGYERARFCEGYGRRKLDGRVLLWTIKPQICLLRLLITKSSKASLPNKFLFLLVQVLVL